jgi:hypothetical protein
MKHILNDLSEQEKNSIREQHTGGMKVMTESFSKLINSKLGDVKPLVNEQDLMGMMNQVLTGFGDSDKKVKEFCDICNKENSSYRDRGLVNRYADVIRDAVQGPGTNEESIYHVFDSLVSFNEFCGLVKAYKNSYNVDLYTDLSSDISNESEWARIMRPIRNLVKNIQPSEDQIGPPLTPAEKEKLEREALIRTAKGERPSTGSQPLPKNAPGSQPTSPTSRTPVR